MQLYQYALPTPPLPKSPPTLEVLLELVFLELPVLGRSKTAILKHVITNPSQPLGHASVWHRPPLPSLRRGTLMFALSG